MASYSESSGGARGVSRVALDIGSDREGRVTQQSITNNHNLISLMSSSCPVTHQKILFHWWRWQIQTEQLWRSQGLTSE